MWYLDVALLVPVSLVGLVGLVGLCTAWCRCAYVHACVRMHLHDGVFVHDLQALQETCGAAYLPVHVPDQSQSKSQSQPYVQLQVHAPRQQVQDMLQRFALSVVWMHAHWTTVPTRSSMYDTPPPVSDVPIAPDVIVMGPDGELLRLTWTPRDSTCKRLLAMIRVVTQPSGTANATHLDTYIVSNARWRDLLRDEADARTSPETQRRMYLAEQHVNTEWMDVAHDIQMHLLRAPQYADILAAYHGNLPAALAGLRAAAVRNPELAIQVKWNKARRAALELHGLVAAPHMRILDLQGTPHVPGAISVVRQPTFLSACAWHIVITGSLS